MKKLICLLIVALASAGAGAFGYRCYASAYLLPFQWLRDKPWILVHTPQASEDALQQALALAKEPLPGHRLGLMMRCCDGRQFVVWEAVTDERRDGDVPAGNGEGRVPSQQQD